MRKNIFHLINKATKDHNLKNSEVRILLCLISYNSFKKIFPSLETISLDTGIKSKPDISKGLQRLKELDYIEIKRRKHQTNIYILNTDNIEIKKKVTVKNIESTIMKNIFYSVIYIYSKINNCKENECDIDFLKRVIDKNKKSGINYIQKCMILCYVINDLRTKINDPKYKGILYNTYRSFDYQKNIKDTIESKNESLLLNEYEVLN